MQNICCEILEGLFLPIKRCSMPNQAQAAHVCELSGTALQGTITNIQPTYWTIQIDPGYPTDLPLMGTGHLASLYDQKGQLVQNASEVYTGQWSNNGNNSLTFQVK